MFDVTFARSQFPAFAKEPTRTWGFFQNAGGSYLPAAVLDRYVEFLTDFKVQPYGDNPMAKRAGEAMDAGRATLADLLGVPIDRLTIGPSTTQNLNTLANAFRGNLGPGDEIIVTDQDHEANIGCWERLCDETGANLLWWHVDPTSGLLDIEDLESTLTDAVVVVAMTHVSNVAGVINPVAQVAELVHMRNRFLIVDGVAAAPHMWPHVDATGADAYLFSLYKTFAPHLGAMVTTPRLLEAVTPQSHFFNTDVPWKRLDGAGPDHAAIAALVGLGDYFDTLADHHGINVANRAVRVRELSELMRAHESELALPLVELLLSRGTRVIGTTDHPDKVANFSLAPKQPTARSIVDRLAESQIAADADHFYAARLVAACGIENVARISFAHYNTAEEVTRMVDTLATVL